ncbi:MAG: type VI secretion system tube protein Hcp [Planctomycetota bacterium]
MIFVHIPGCSDDSIKTEGYTKNWFVADSFSFGVEREMKESGEKGGTSDMNIGVGELQECSITKSMDWASTRLCQLAINGNSPGGCEINFVEVAHGGSGIGDAKPYCYLKYKLDRCFVKSWSTSGDADDRPTEEVSFYYNKIAFNYAKTSDGVEWKDCDMVMAWDNTEQKKWDKHGLTYDAKKGFGVLTS